MPSPAVSLGIFTSALLFLIGSSESGKIGQTQYYNGFNNTLECYSCMSVEKNPGFSDEGCAKKKVPSRHLTKDCYGFHSQQALAAIRHVSGADRFGYNPDPLNKHCVLIKGWSETSGQVLVRGCLALPTHEHHDKTTCMTEKDFLLPGVGLVRNVNHCYCRNKNGCNGSSGPVGVNGMIMSLSLLVLGFIKTMY